MDFLNVSTSNGIFKKGKMRGWAGFLVLYAVSIYITAKLQRKNSMPEMRSEAKTVDSHCTDDVLTTAHVKNTNIK